MVGRFFLVKALENVKNVLENTLEKSLNFSFAKVWEPCYKFKWIDCRQGSARVSHLREVRKWLYFFIFNFTRKNLFFGQAMAKSRASNRCHTEIQI